MGLKNFKSVQPRAEQKSGGAEEFQVFSPGLNLFKKLLQVRKNCLNCIIITPIFLFWGKMTLGGGSKARHFI